MLEKSYWCVWYKGRYYWSHCLYQSRTAYLLSQVVWLNCQDAYLNREAMSRLVNSFLVFFLFIIGGCFPMLFKAKRKYKKSCCFKKSDMDSSSCGERSLSFDSMSVEEPTTWKMPPKRNPRIRTISGASNFSGTSNISNLSERDRMWLQAFRFAGR